MSEIVVVTPVIARSLSFQFAGERVLEELDFRVEPGEFVSIVGPSGCGKSTLLRLLAGLRPPPDPQMIQGLPDRVGFVFQHPTLCPWRTVRDNVALPLELQGVRSRQRFEAADAAIEQVDLDRSARNKLPKQLSGGMQMRVSLARALVTQPEMLLLDEPLSALDELLRQQLAEMLWSLWQRQRWTTVLVTHNMSEAIYLSQRILILAGKPARIAEEIVTPTDHRQQAEYRTSIEFAQSVASASQRLRDAIERIQSTEVQKLRE